MNQTCRVLPKWIELEFEHEFYLVLPSLLGFTGFYWVLLGFTGFYLGRGVPCYEGLASSLIKKNESGIALMRCESCALVNQINQKKIKKNKMKSNQRRQWQQPNQTREAKWKKKKEKEKKKERPFVFCFRPLVHFFFWLPNLFFISWILWRCLKRLGLDIFFYYQVILFLTFDYLC